MAKSPNLKTEELSRPMQEQFVHAPKSSSTRIVDGVEVPDPTPMEPPLNFQYREPLALQVRRMVRSEALRMAAEAAGMETFEEADDFDVGDDEDDLVPSRWENEHDPDLSHLVKAGSEELTKKEKEAAAAAAAQAANPPSGDGDGGSSAGAKGGRLRFL